VTSERLLNLLYFPKKLLHLPKQISGYAPAAAAAAAAGGGAVYREVDD